MRLFKASIPALVALGVVSCSNVQTSPADAVKLSDGWKIYQDNSKVKYPATVPTTVAGALYDCGQLPSDLFLAENYSTVDKSRFDVPWWFETSFKANPSGGRHFFLKFEGIDYRADIILNDVQLAESENTFGVFKHFEYDVTDFVKASNKLKVKISRAQPGDLNIGFVDWNPHALGESMGIWRDVTLNVTGDVKMDDLYVRPLLDVTDMDEADIVVSCVLTNLTSEPVSASLDGMFNGMEFSFPVRLAASESREVVMTSEDIPAFHVNEPRIWWCQPLGSPELYDIVMNCNVDGVLSDSESVTFGIRDIKSFVDEEGHRQFVLNGEPVLLRGAGWTDDLLLRDTPQSIETQVRYVKDMNLNCIRFENIWGKDRTVYQMCDKYGILAMVGWSCQWEWENYCGLPENGRFGCIASRKDQDLAAEYFETQLKWLRNSPSVIGFLVGSDAIPAPELEERYLEIMSRVDYRPYVNSAADATSEVSGPSGMKMNGPYDFEPADYWYLDERNGGAFGFNTETGIGLNMPVLESLQKMIPADSLWPLSKSWNYHCTTAGSMNTTRNIEKPVAGMYGEATGLEDFIKKAQALDYDGTRVMFEAFRANEPHTTGIIQWMLNSAWPAVYWQLYDWFKVPTAGYYGVKNSNRPVQMVYNYKDNCVYAVNSTRETVGFNALVEVYDTLSTRLLSEEVEVAVNPREPVKVYDLNAFEGKPYFLYLLNEDSGVDNFYCIPSSDTEYSRRSRWYMTPVSTFPDMRFVSDMPEADVVMTVEQTETDGLTDFEVTLTNESDKISYMNAISIKNAGGELIVPAFWSDNYITLMPGCTRVLHCTVDSSLLTGPACFENKTWN